jgi:GT2 family glycosyltransferase
MTAVSIIVVSYNTRQVTLDCLASVYRQTRIVPFELLVVDNASTDGSAAAIAEAFPQVKLRAHDRNIGFAAANNLAAREAGGRYLLLLNPDTVVLDGAIDRLVTLADQHPGAGIYGGRTVGSDGRLNPSSCWGRQTPWSEICHGLGLAAAFPRSRCFNPEGMGRWQRDTVREVDIVSGCFLLIRRQIWEQLNGFDESFFMYGEEADLCLRARDLGCRPTIFPQAQIIHYGGLSETSRADKLVRLLRARRQLARRHWQARWARLGLWMQEVGVLNRILAWSLLRYMHVERAEVKSRMCQEVWRRRAEWASA